MTTKKIATETAAEQNTAQPAPTHNIRSVPDTGFWRADCKWHPAGKDVNRADYSDEQWDELLAEPLLVVTAL